MAMIQRPLIKELVLPAQRPRRSCAQDDLQSLKAVVLLGGSLRATTLNKAIGRCVLDLPIDKNVALLDHWQQQIEDLARALNMDHLAVRVVIDHKSAAPTERKATMDRAVMVVERDPVELRGTAGLLRDMAECYHDEDRILVGGASKVLLEPLWALTKVLSASHSDLSLIAHEDGTPSSLMLIRCGCLRQIPRVGFVDMKEQGLPGIAVNHKVHVVQRAEATGIPIGSPQSYIRAVRAYQRSLTTTTTGARSSSAPFVEDWQADFALIEDPASVDVTAQVYDSVILRGAQVERNAIVVRSVVCPGGVVGKNRTVMDTVVTAPNGRTRRESSG